MKTWTVRLGLSLMVVVCLWASRASAQEYVGEAQKVFVVPTVPFIPEFHPYYPPPLPAPPPPAPAIHGVVRTLNHFGMGYAADSFGSTGNFCSEFGWAFGSSRFWFRDYLVPCGQPGADGRNP